MNETLKKDITEAVNKIAKKHPHIDKKEFEEIFTKVLDKEISPKDAMGFTNETMEAIYGLGYRLYNTGKYESALQHFRLIFLLNPIEARYSTAIASCHHILKDYDRAVSLYELASILNPSDPLTPFHLSDCYLKLGNRKGAILALQKTCEVAKNNPQHLILAERAALTLNNLIKNGDDLAKQGETAKAQASSSIPKKGG